MSQSRSLSRRQFAGLAGASMASAACPVGTRRGPREVWVAAVTMELFHTDFHLEKMRKLTAKYGRAVRVKWLHLEHWFTLEVVALELTLAELKAAFGLTPLREYLARATQAQRANQGAG